MLEGRLRRILTRYLGRLAPLAAVHLAGELEVCAVDLARWRGLRPAREYQYDARLDGAELTVRLRSSGGLCVRLPAPRASRAPSDSAERYKRVVLTSNRAEHPLVIDLYAGNDGYEFAGLEREP